LRGILAVVTIVIFTISSFAVANPVQAHFTLGQLTGTYRFHELDFDPHVSGVVGYVWPGGGQNAYTGSSNYASDNLSPGYQTPYPCVSGGEPTGNGGRAGSNGNPSGCIPQGAPSSSWYQLEGSAYAPFGAVLADSTGDLIFALNATAHTNPGGCAANGNCPDQASTLGPGDRLGWSGVTLFLPPGFTLPTMDGSNVVTTITNSYANIQVYRVSPYDRYAPGWTAVNIWTDGGQSAVNNANLPYYNHQFINFTSLGEWYYVRINGVTAPSVAGRYFFKMLLSGDSNYLAGPEGIATNSTASVNYVNSIPAEAPTQFIPTANWPVLLVKGEIDPGILTGTIRYGGYNSTLYGMPIGEAGRVYAHMDEKIDPYTGQQMMACPAIGQPSVAGCTDAVGYFNATAQGHYEVEGLASGIYDIYAEAAGFPQQPVEASVTILKGQSLHFDGYVQPGPVIHGDVYTKHQFGDEPWMQELLNPNGECVLGDGCYNEYIKIELYDSPTLTNIPNPSANLVSWSPVPCVAGGQDLFFPKGHAGSCGDPRTASEVAFPWHEYTTANGYNVKQVSLSGQWLNTNGCPSTTNLNCIPLTQDPQGVGPPQNWFVQGGTTTPFHFEMGVKGEYGAPRDLDGMVPQVYATWVNGLTPGRYYARAWVFRYVQTALDGVTFQEYYFDITPQEWAGDVTLPIDLRLSSWVNKTVHFHNQLNSLIEDPINSGAGFLTGYLVGADGNIYSYNQTALGLTCSTGINPTIKCDGNTGVVYPFGGGGGGWNIPDPMYGGNTATFVHGFGYSGKLNPGGSSGVNLDPFGVNHDAIQEGRAAIQFWGINDTWSGENYGVPTGTFTPYTYVLGYEPAAPLEQVSVTLSGTMSEISDHMIRGPGFNLTLYSVDWERPTVNRAWEFGNNEGWNPVAGSYSSQLSSPFSNGFFNSNNVGLSIGIGAYLNNTLADWTGDEEATNLASSIRTSNLYQSARENNVSLDGGGIAVTSITGALEDANQSWFGSELKRPGYVGGYLSPSTATGAQPFLVAGNFHNVNVLFSWPHILEPTAFTPGMYSFGAYTYGYVQDQTYMAYADLAQIADLQVNLVIGVNITLDILFETEHIITGTPFNMSARIRVFNDQSQLVGEWMSSNGVYTPNNGTSPQGHVNAADGTAQFPFGPVRTGIPSNPLNEYNYVPGGITLLHTVIAGLPQIPAWGYDAPAGLPSGAYSGDPVFTPNACDFELVCYASGFSPSGRLGPGNLVPGQGMSYPFPNTGISGYPDYQGGWTAEADFVPWYANNSRGPETSSGGYQTPSGSAPGSEYGQYYAPVNGLLYGESYHIIEGTTATSGISLTEDAALSSTFLGHSMVMNHLGPYSQQGVWQISGAHLSGEASAIFAVNLNGFISGNVLAFTWVNDFRPLSWASVSVEGASGTSWTFYSFDGLYGMYLPDGTYQLTISNPGISSQTLAVAVTGGEVGTAGDVYMQQSNVPVPEFSGIAIIAFAALAASLYLLKRRRL